ncbi:MAG: response regulator [Streptomyces sp.]|nr:response regulator [Streptomyces sp.]
MTGTTPEKAAILLVDDKEENLVALEAVLDPLRQNLVRASSGEEALKAMLRQEFAVVLLDIQMPGMDGIETASNIKHLDQTKDVPIIIVTGTDTDVYRGYSVGAADFLIKPFAPWLLRTKVNVFLDLYRKSRQLAEQAEQLQRRLNASRTADAPALDEIAEHLAQAKRLLEDSGPSDDRAALVRHLFAAEEAVDTLR